MDAKVAFFLKSNEKNVEGRCSVMGRLTVGRSESVFSTKMLVQSSLWSSGRAKGKSAEAVEINRQLDEYRASALAIYREQSAVRERVMDEKIKCLLLGMAAGQETVLDYFHTLMIWLHCSVVNSTSIRVYNISRVAILFNALHERGFIRWNWRRFLPKGNFCLKRAAASSSARPIYPPLCLT